MADINNSPYARLQNGLGLGEIRTAEDIARLVKNGLPASVIRSLISMGIPEETIFSIVIPRRTLSRRQAKGELLSVGESDKAMRLARVFALAEQVFANHDKALHWMTKPNHRLDGKTPMQMLATGVGAEVVEGLLYGIDD